MNKQEILKRINEELSKYTGERVTMADSRERDVWNNGYDNGMAQGLVIAKAFILSEQSEQKEPCEQSKENKRAGWSAILNSIATTKPLTIGDKIRESNESLAEFLKKGWERADYEFVYCKHICKNRDDNGCKYDECIEKDADEIAAYLNQPSNDAS
jgi:hypothetical protein